MLLALSLPRLSLSSLPPFFLRNHAARGVAPPRSPSQISTLRRRMESPCLPAANSDHRAQGPPGDSPGIPNKLTATPLHPPGRRPPATSPSRRCRGRCAAAAANPAESLLQGLLRFPCGRDAAVSVRAGAGNGPRAPTMAPQAPRAGHPHLNGAPAARGGWLLCPAAKPGPGKALPTPLWTRFII